MFQNMKNFEMDSSMGRRLDEEEFDGNAKRQSPAGAVYLVRAVPICERATVYALPYVILMAAACRPAIIEETDYTTIIRYALWLPVRRSANKPTCDIWIMRHKLRLRSKLACFEFNQEDYKRDEDRSSVIEMNSMGIPNKPSHEALTVNSFVQGTRAKCEDGQKRLLLLMKMRKHAGAKYEMITFNCVNFFHTMYRYVK